jgi:hypothetical protein
LGQYLMLVLDIIVTKPDNTWWYAWSPSIVRLAYWEGQVLPQECDSGERYTTYHFLFTTEVQIYCCLLCSANFLSAHTSPKA